MEDVGNTQIVMSVAEIEEWMDEAMNDIDDGFNNLFSFMNLLNQRTVQMMSELMEWHRIRRWFTALNLFAVPMLLAFGLVYGTNQVLEQSMLEGRQKQDFLVLLHSVIALLMFLSWSIGFPFYVFSIWQTYFDESDFERVCRERLHNDIWEQDKNGSMVSAADLPLVEDSFLDFGRMMNNKIRDNIRLEFQKRMTEAVEVQAAINLTSSNPPSSETSDNFYYEIKDWKEQKEAEKKGVADYSEVKGNSTDIACSEIFQKEQESCGVKVIILNASQDLSVEIEKEAPEDNEQEPAYDQGIKILVDKERMTSVEATPRTFRSIPVENIGEGDSRSGNALKKDDNLMQIETVGRVAEKMLFANQ